MTRDDERFPVVMADALDDVVIATHLMADTDVEGRAHIRWMYLLIARYPKLRKYEEVLRETRESSDNPLSAISETVRHLEEAANDMSRPAL